MCSGCTGVPNKVTQFKADYKLKQYIISYKGNSKLYLHLNVSTTEDRLSTGSDATDQLTCSMFVNQPERVTYDLSCSFLIIIVSVKSIKSRRETMNNKQYYTFNCLKICIVYTLFTGAAQKPYVTNLDQNQTWALLSCEVHGAFPKPDVQWQNRAGDLVPAEEPQVSERGGSYDIILQTTVTKTDHYRCVSTQKEIKHKTHAEIFVLMNGQLYFNLQIIVLWSFYMFSCWKVAQSLMKTPEQVESVWNWRFYSNWGSLTPSLLYRDKRMDDEVTEVTQ